MKTPFVCAVCKQWESSVTPLRVLGFVAVRSAQLSVAVHTTGLRQKKTQMATRSFYACRAIGRPLAYYDADDRIAAKCDPVEPCSLHYCGVGVVERRRPTVRWPPDTATASEFVSSARIGWRRGTSGNEATLHVNCTCLERALHRQCLTTLTSYAHARHVITRLVCVWPTKLQSSTVDAALASARLAGHHLYGTPAWPLVGCDGHVLDIGKVIAAAVSDYSGLLPIPR